MSQFFQIHPDNPQPRLVKQAVDMIRSGAVIVYPTDSGYALGCHLDDKKAFDRIRSIRQLSEKHHFTLVCRDLSELGTYAKVGNTAYRLLKSVTPGPYTFVLPATREVPRRLQQPKRKTIGLRVPANPIARALLGELGEPMVSTTLILPGQEIPESDPEDIRDRLEHAVDLIIDGGYGGLEPTTVVAFEDDTPEILRHGLGDPAPFEI
ncbi:L-threonylcarbamoyladenylate synthase [Thiohalomonas denitrificans]|uniref:tRNA threonylcarbamoyl adenosine modification protein, Sua5/YciO/YrdC/YwlC family n=1 Tax=Thiohalomonas denitrificans TaxID=415747 RepID=A0A1G5PIP5_9GAMM|nr:L-threonylcarbamoyladenylate synthase [Thiohalomonas denitrificans]SCZ49298.1 tRNA threonylcarbamoyl adenosine modification protein, Sua5/YciO/YrdC/YwlC family [Thiohalomonas denitrificans]